MLSQTEIVVYRHEINNNFSQLLENFFTPNKQWAFIMSHKGVLNDIYVGIYVKTTKKNAIKKTKESRKEK